MLLVRYVQCMFKACTNHFVISYIEHSISTAYEERNEKRNNTKNTDICDYYSLNKRIILQINSRKQINNKNESPNFYNRFIINLIFFFIR